MGIKDENYIIITGWMRNELGLKPNELIVYALIHGFCQDGRSVFTGGIKYIMEWAGLTKQTCITILKTLRKRGYIERRAVHDPKSGNFSGYEYFTQHSRGKKSEDKSFHVPQNYPAGQVSGGQKNLPLYGDAEKPKNSVNNSSLGQNLLPGESKNFTAGGQLFLPNNTSEISKDIATDCSNIKSLADKHFGLNAFDEAFPSKAAAFLVKNNIKTPDRYFEFIRNKVLEKERTSEVLIRSPRSFAYKLIFQVDIAQEFLNQEEEMQLEAEKAEAERIRIEKRKIPCPCCGERFIADFKNNCPKCDFSVDKFNDDKEVEIHKRFLQMPPPKREKYTGELEKIYFTGNFLKFIGMTQEERNLDARRKEEQKAALDKKYGLLEEA